MAVGLRDYFVLKPKHSAFFATPLETLLKYLDTRTLILAGITGDMCVLFTAADAFLRDYDVIVPEKTAWSRSSRRTTTRRLATWRG